LSQGGRRLAAIMFTDMVDYTTMTEKNEAVALTLLEEHRQLLRPVFARHGGREVKTVGDGFLVELPSALEAVRCALDPAAHAGAKSERSFLEQDTAKSWGSPWRR